MDMENEMDLRNSLLPAFCALLICTAPPADVDARLKQKKPYKVQWSEDGGRIDTSSVCGNLARSSLEYRECRSYAVDVFKSKCRKYRRRLEKAGGTSRARERRTMQKFCSASRRFSP